MKERGELGEGRMEGEREGEAWFKCHINKCWVKMIGLQGTALYFNIQVLQDI